MNKYLDNVFTHLWSIWDHQDYFRTKNECLLVFNEITLSLYCKKVVNEIDINNDGDGLIGIYNAGDKITEVSLISKGFHGSKMPKTAHISYVKLYPKKQELILHNTGLKLVGSQLRYQLETESQDLMAVYVIIHDVELRKHLALDSCNRIMISHPHVINTPKEIPDLISLD